MKALARICVLHPRTALATLAALTAFFAAGLLRLETDVGYRAFLGEQHPSIRNFDDFLERFGGGLAIAAVWSCDDTEICTQATDAAALEMADEIGAALAAIDGIRGVSSPANATLLVPSLRPPGDPAGPPVVLPRRLIEAGEIVSDRAELAGRAALDPSWVGQLISADGRIGAVVAELSSSDGELAREAYRALDTALGPWEARGVVFHRVGGPVEFVVAGGELEAATASTIPFMVALVAAILWVLTRSWRSAAAVLASVGIAVLWTLGSLGWLSLLGWAQNSLTQTLPPLVLVIGICDGLHLVSRLASRSTASSAPETHRENVLSAAGDVASPCLMTTLTTAAGFLSFASAELQSFVRFGAIAALGVAFALVLCFTLLPILLCAFGPDPAAARSVSRRWERGLAGGLRFAGSHRIAILALAALLGIVCGVGFARLEVDASFEELYGEDSQVVVWARFVSDHLRRPDTLEVDLELPASAELADPAVLHALREIQDPLASIESLGPARSLLAPLSWLHRLSRGDDPAEAHPSDRRGVNVALLAQLRSDDGDGRGLRRWVDAGERHVRISLESEKTPQAELRRTMAAVGERLAALPPGFSANATGPLSVVHDMIEAIRTTQIRSFLGAGVAVGLLLIFFLRSPRLAGMALVPTVLPVVVTLGAMGWLGVPLDVGSAMVAAVVLGIAVDDAIHLLDAFRRARAGGASPAEAIERAGLDVGRALVTTSIALSVGFGALTLSPWRSVASFGGISAIAIAAALGSCLIVLPALTLALSAAPAEAESSRPARGSGGQ